MSASGPERLDEHEPEETAGQGFEPGARFAGKYLIQKQLGAGGFGAVYLVENELGWQMALKVLHPDLASNERYRKRFLREMALARDLLHENAVPVRDAGLADGRLYYTMDYVAGKTFADVIEAEGRISIERTISWMRQVLSFLEFLHGKGFIHRDLKPANLMLEEEGGKERVRVLDLGIARTIAQDQKQTVLTGGVAIGTPSYMAPEYISGDPIDERIDLYAVGVVLYECLSGQRPFQADTVQKLCHVVRTDPPQPLPELLPGFSERLWGVIDRALTKDPEWRFATARALLEALEAISEPAAGEDETTRQLEEVSATLELETLNRRRKWAILAAVLLLVACVGGAILWFSIGPGPGITVVEPQAGERIRGPTAQVVLEVTGSEPFELRVGEEVIPLTATGSDAHYRGELSLRGDEGETTVPFLVADRWGRTCAGELSVDVDSSEPRVIEITPTSGKEIEARQAEIVVKANEPLAAGTRIDGRAAVVAGATATATVEARAFGHRSIPILLVDEVGNAFVHEDYYLEFKAAAPAAPEPTSAPEFDVVAPIEGSTHRGSSVQVRIEVRGKERCQVFLDEAELAIDPDGRAEDTWKLRVENGPEEIPVRVVRGGKTVAKKIGITVDNRGPKLESVDPKPGTAVDQETVEITVSADEELGEPTRIGDAAVAIEGRIARARLTISSAAATFQIVLVDRFGNETEAIPYLLTRKPAEKFQVPPGMEALKETRADGFGYGLATPIREPRTGIVLVLVPPTAEAGFLMGAPEEDADADKDEKPRHRVVISRPFYLGKTEVTRKQWSAGVQARAVPELENVVWDAEEFDGDHPAVLMTWEQARAYCRWLGMDLPTEAQWEWSCRHENPAGLYPWGDDFEDGKDWANVRDIAGRKWANLRKPAAAFDDGHVYTAPAAPFRATKLGLQHLIGNVLEWCRDVYVEDAYERRATQVISDPHVKETTEPVTSHVLRGGAFKEGARDCRIARRWKIAGDPYDDVGFRVCLELKSLPKQEEP